MIDWLNDNSGAVQAIAVVALVLVTVVYAVLTWRVAGAARQQADASVDMAREMREQRLSAHRPNVLLDLDGTKPGSLLYIQGRTPTPDLDGFPEDVQFTARNYGPGPAFDLDATVYFRDAPSFRDERQVLSPGDRWRCELGTRFALVPGQPSANDVLKELGVNDPTNSLAVTVQYRDVHGRSWVTYMVLHLNAEPTGNPDEPDELCVYVEQGTRGIRPPEDV